MIIMDSLRIQDLRALEDTDFIELKPLTLLLGKNSSGKSTFLRSLLLFRQSVESRTKGPILWYGQLTDFGSFQEAINKNSKSNEICFHFKVNIPTEFATAFSYGNGNQFLGNIEATVSLKMSTDPQKEFTKTRECQINIYGHSILIKFDNEGKVTNFVVNKQDLSAVGSLFRSYQSGCLVPRLHEEQSTTMKNQYMHMYGVYYKNTGFTRQVKLNIQKLVPRAGERTVTSAAFSLGMGTPEDMLRQIKSCPSLKKSKSWLNITSDWTVDTDRFLLLQNAVIAHHTAQLLIALDEYLTRFSTKILYSAPLRATAERYYRLQDLAVDEVDSQGRNLAMFLKNLTETDRKGFSEWTENHFGFSVQIRYSGGHVSLKLKESNSLQEFNLADMGFGFSQILPILTQLWAIGTKKSQRKQRFKIPVTFAIEQPELHLHPKLQAQLADAFLSTIKAAKNIGVEIKLIIETHSETMINRFGHQIQKKYFNSSEVNVVIFEKSSPESSTSIRIGNYNKDGFLENWPYGFFEPGMVK